MAAIYGPSVNFWNISITEEVLKLQQILKGYFATMSLTTGIALVVLGPFIMFANGIVIAAIWKDPFKQLRSSPSNMIIASMAVCDFLVGLVAIVLSSSWTMALFMEDEVGILLAPVAYTLTELLIKVSLMHILGLTIDRVLAVVNPLLYKSRVTRKRALLSVILVWIGMTLLFVPSRQLLQCYYYFYNVISVALLGIIASLTTCLCCLVIFKVRRQTRIMKKNQKPIILGNRIVFERDRKTTKSILVILVLFILCITVYVLSTIVLLSCLSCHPRLDVIVTAYYLSLLLLHVNSLINPILYAFRIPKFRKPVVFIMKKIKRRNYCFRRSPNFSR